MQEGTIFEPLMRYENFKRVFLDEMHGAAWDIDPAVNSEEVWNNRVNLCPDACYMDSVPAEPAAIK